MRTLAGCRVDSKYNQADVAEMLGINSASYSSFEKIASDPDMLAEIAKVLKVKEIQVVVEP